MMRIGILLQLLVVLILLWQPADAEEQLAYDFTGFEPGRLCGTWEMHHWVWFTTDALETSACGGGGGACFATAASDGLTFLVSQLEIEPFAMLIWGITRVEVDLIERDPALTATLRGAAAAEAQSMEEGPITLAIDSSGGAVFSCCYCTITQVRLIGDNIVASTVDSWGALKSRY